MDSALRGHLGLVKTIAVAGIAVPLLLYAMVIGRAPTVTPAEARELVDKGLGVLVLVEQGSAADGYLDVASSWPMAEVMRARNREDVPAELRGHKLLLVCPGGIRSAQAARHLRGIGLDVASVRGGSQQWVSYWGGRSGQRTLNPMEKDYPAVDGVAMFRPSPVYEQWMALGTFFGVKLVYTALSVVIALKLQRRREGDLAAVRWAMLFFLIGEACCFVNVMGYRDGSVLLEHLHSVGMVLALAFAAYALMEALDRRIIHYSDKAACALGQLCRGCIKHSDVGRGCGCGLRRLFLILVPGIALVAAMPLFSPFRDQAYNTLIVHAMHTYKHPIVHQVYELRVLPLMAIILLVFCSGTLIVERYPVSRAKVFFAAAIGAMGFAFFRLVLVASFINNQVWFAAWEEITELIFVASVGGVLIIFARGLFEPRHAAAGALV